LDLPSNLLIDSYTLARGPFSILRSGDILFFIAMTPAARTLVTM
jgi:hypothetical protein